MKRLYPILLCIAMFALSVPAQLAQPSGPSGPAAPPIAATDYSIVERGPHHRIWERTEYEPAPDGSSVPRLHRYTELATGMHYRDPHTGQWLESQDLVESFPGGAVARHGQIQVIFANNLATAGAIDLQHRLRLRRPRQPPLHQLSTIHYQLLV